MKPLIAVSTGYSVDSKGREVMTLYAHYLNALRAAGALPVAVPPIADADEADRLFAELDGLLLTGGDDIHSRRFGQELHPKAGLMHPKREESDFALFAAADRRELPIFGICLGCQEINVARGGTLHQHLPDVPTVTATHSGAYPDRARHRVRLKRDSRLYDIFRAEDVTVNSAHHQGVDRIGDRLRPTAFSEDGLVEGLEDINPRRFVLAVQWHPEELQADRAEQRELFRRFVEACGSRIPH